VRDQLLRCHREEVGELDPVNADSDRVQEHRAADAFVLAHAISEAIQPQPVAPQLN
jgi:hypothetical protein